MGRRRSEVRWPRRYSLLLGVGSLVVLTDQITKIWVDKTMSLYESTPIVPGLLYLHYIRNTGAAFGFLSGSHSGFRIPFFILVSSVAIGIILFLFYKLEESEVVMPLALSLVLGGAIGNLIDRIRQGEVIDFILFHYKAFQWPAFNVADIAITVGVTLLVLKIFLLDKRRPAKSSP
jgi:signal peptidase II